MNKLFLFAISISLINLGSNLFAQPCLPEEIIVTSTTPIDNSRFQSETGIKDKIDADLFVSPDGDNNNSGLSEDSPFKTINYALSVIDADSTHPHIIHLLDGEYNEDNGNSFPITMPEYVTLSGTDKSRVILNGGYNEGKNESIFLFSDRKHVQIINLTIRGGGGMLHDDGFQMGGGIVCINSNPVLKDLIITKNETVGFGGGLYIESSEPILENLTITENIGRSGGGGMKTIYSNLKLLNVSLEKNTSVQSGGGIEIDVSSVVLINCLFIGNRVVESGPFMGGGGISYAYSDLTFINTTIANNKIIANEGKGGAIYSYDSKSSFINSIIWDNVPNEIYCSQFSGNTVTFNNTDLKGGVDSITYYSTDTIRWLEGNIELDPHFINTGDNPYQLNAQSPCIDAGTPDTIGLILPEYDLAGNVRIFNNRIDMGVYEWYNLGIGDFISSSIKGLKVSIHPNPLSTATSIEYYIEQPETVHTSFYNQFGKQVDLLEEYQAKGQNKIVWTPRDLPDGIYYFKIVAGKKTSSGKLILSK